MRFVKKAISMSLAAALLFLEAGIPVYAQDIETAIADAQEETEYIRNEYLEQDNNDITEAEGLSEDAYGRETAEDQPGESVGESMDAVLGADEDLSGSDDAGAFPDTGRETSAAETVYSEDAPNTLGRAGSLSLTVDVPQNIKCKEEVSFILHAAGGSGDYKYRTYWFDIEDPSGWVPMYDVGGPKNTVFYENTEVKFSFYVPGNYRIRFHVQDKITGAIANTGFYNFTINDSRYPSVEQIVNKISEECLAKCSTDFEKAVWLHDWIADHAEYDYSLSYGSAEGVLARGIGTCESYHRAYVMLLNKVGIDTGRITGNQHVWTAVKMDGEWYQVDATWDDNAGTYDKHIYFGLTDELMGLVHDQHTSATPGYESTALKNNYYLKTGEIKRWSDYFVPLIKENIAKGQSEFNLAVPKNGMLLTYARKIIYYLTAYHLSGQDWGEGVNVSASYSYAEDELIVKVEKTVDELVSLIVTPPNKTLYEMGEPVNRTGLSVTAVYASGTKKILNENEYRLEGFGTNTVGSHTATITYDGKSAAFSYTVKEKPNTGGGNSGGGAGEGNNGDGVGGNTEGGSGETTQPEKPKPVGISYRTHVQSIGWQGFAANGVMSGTIGKAKRLEGIEIKLDTTANLGVQYTTHCQSYGWLPWSSNGETNGTTGEAKRLEAIKIQLAGADKAQYDIYYRVHAQTYGWLNWVKNGEAAGTAGYAKRLEGIQIVVVKKGENFDRNMQGITSNEHRGFIAGTGGEPEVGGAESANTAYRTHVQTYGWQGFKYNGQTSGTTGKAKRLEGIELRLTNQQYDGGIEYRTHIQKIGWQGWKANGEMSGTSGEAKRLEAIEIRLTGTMEKHYDIYYRVHAQKFGWMGWAKNGESAGTAGHAYRLEGIEIKLVPKGSPAPGSTERPFVQK